MPVCRRDYSIDRRAVKALVAVYGIREAARQSGIPVGTISSWSCRFKWKKADKILLGTNGALSSAAIAGKDAADLLTEALTRHRQDSTLHLAHYTARAAKKAAEHEDPLSIAGKVKDVAGVYGTLFPPEEGGDLIEGAILVGSIKVKDSPEEMLARAQVVEDDVRETLPDQGPEGD